MEDMRRFLAAASCAALLFVPVTPALADETSSPAPVVSSTTAPATPTPSGEGSSPSPSPSESIRPDSSSSTFTGPGTDLGPTVLPEGVYITADGELPNFLDEDLWLKGPTYFAIWPLVGSELWTPIRQGWIRFDKPVKSSTAEFTLTDATGASAGDIVRATKGEEVREVRFNFPTLVPGEYQVSFSVQADDGTIYAGDIPFTIMTHKVGIGGGNHRHGSTHVRGEQVPEAIIRALLIIAAAGVFAVAAFRRKSLLTEWAVRPAWLLSALAAAIGIGWSLLGEAHGVGEELTDRLGSGLFWTWAGMLVLSIAMLVWPRPEKSASVVPAVLALAAVAYSSHVLQTQYGFFLATLQFAALLSAALALAVLGLRVLAAFSIPVPPVWLRRRNLAVMLATPTAMLAVLFGYVGGFSPVLSHADDLRLKLTVGVVWLSVGVAFAFIKGSSRVVKVALSFLFVVATALGIVLTSLPPGAAGI